MESFLSGNAFRRLSETPLGLEEGAARMLFEAERPKFLMSEREQVREILVERRRVSGHFFTALIFLVHFWIKPKMHIPFRKEAQIYEEKKIVRRIFS
jgi:hypothetical protein